MNMHRRRASQPASQPDMQWTQCGEGRLSVYIDRHMESALSLSLSLSRTTETARHVNAWEAGRSINLCGT